MSTAVQSKATIIEMTPLSKQTIKVELVAEEPFTHKAGQWLDCTVIINGEKKVGGYTLCGPAGTQRNIELAIRRSTHPVSNWIHQRAMIGDVVEVYGGCGRCIYEPINGDDVLFVVGGIGLTPVISMIRTIAHQFPLTTARLFYSVQKNEDVLYKDELNALDKRFSVHYRYTNIDGRWHPNVLLEHMRAKTKIYIFGPTTMIEEWSNYLSARGFKDRLHFEKWW